MLIEARAEDELRAVFFVCARGLARASWRAINEPHHVCFHAGGNARLNDSGRHGSTAAPAGRFFSVSRIFTTAAATCVVNAASSPALCGPYKRFCTARTAARTSWSTPLFASHACSPASRLRAVKAGSSCASNGCCLCGDAVACGRGVCGVSGRNRVVRHHSTKVSNHNAAKTAAPICQARTSSVLAAIPLSLVAAGAGAPLAVIDGATGVVAAEDE